MKKLYSSNLQLFKSLLLCNLLALAFGIILIVACRSLIKNGYKINLPVSYPVLLIMLCYFVSVAAITIVPLPFSERYTRTTINLIPVVNTAKNLIDPLKKQSRLLAADVFENILGNLIMFIPFGILFPMINRRLASYKRVIVFAAIGSALIEVAQYFSKYINNYRQVDIDDVILNTLGAVVGFCIYKAWIGGRQTQTNLQAELI